MSPTSRSWLQIHFCVVLWGFTAILGKLITLPAAQLVWWRMLLVSAALLCVPRVWRGLREMSWRLRGIYAGIGLLIGLHWLAFYASIKLSNASVAATCIATGPLFIAWMEPLVTSRRFRWSEVVLGLLAIPAVAVVVGGTPDTMRAGIIAGVIAGALVALFAVFNKQYVDKADAFTVTALELGSGTILLTIIGPLFAQGLPMFALPSPQDFGWLIVLAYGCTLLPFVLALVALRKLSAFGTQLAVNLEPVYAILLAIPIFGEHLELTWTFYAGVIGILAIVLSYPKLQALGARREALADGK